MPTHQHTPPTSPKGNAEHRRTGRWGQPHETQPTHKPQAREMVQPSSEHSHTPAAPTEHHHPTREHSKEHHHKPTRPKPNAGTAAWTPKDREETDAVTARATKRGGECKRKHSETTPSNTRTAEPHKRTHARGQPTSTPTEAPSERTQDTAERHPPPTREAHQHPTRAITARATKRGTECRPGRKRTNARRPTQHQRVRTAQPTVTMQTPRRKRKHPENRPAHRTAAPHRRHRHTEAPRDAHPTQPRARTQAGTTQ